MLDEDVRSALGNVKPTLALAGELTLTLTLTLTLPGNVKPTVASREKYAQWSDEFGSS